MDPDNQEIVTALAGRYVVTSELGRGGMAVVYLAEDVGHNRLVAIKVLRPELTADGVSAERFVREIEIEAALVHPHIVPLHDSGRVGDAVYFVMPFLDGETLRERLEREGVLHVDDAVTILRELASALDYAHGRGVVHRDVKPSNVMLTEGGAMLMDFGVALAAKSARGSRITVPGGYVGTPEFMSPEQATGSDTIDARSDVYALGCVVYEMLAGEPPFTGSLQAIVARHLGAPPPDVTLLRPSLPPGVGEAVQRALAKQPADRFQSAGELARAVEDEVADRPPVGAPGSSQSLRRRWPWIGAGLVLTAALAAAFVSLLDRPAPGLRTVAAVPRQLTFEGDVRQAYGSPDGSLLAYEVVRDGEYRLFVAEGDGASPVQVYQREAFACCPSWSPDGTRILVRSGPRTDGRGLLFPRLGGNPRPLPTDVATAWSPDGERVVGWWPAADTLRFVDVATGRRDGVLPLDIPHDWVQGVHWSPDGQRLAVATAESDSGRAAVLWTVPLDGGAPREVLRDSSSVTSPHWAASGRAIYFLRGGQDVWKIPVDGDGAASGEPVRLAAGLSPNVFNTTLPAFTVSADGERLHYARWDGQANLVRIDLLSTLSGSVPDREWLTSGTAERREPRIAPDGRQVAFVGEGAGGWDLWVWETGGETRRLTHFNGQVTSPAWSPDGHRIAFGGSRQGEWAVWTVAIEGGAASRIGGARYAGEEVTWLSDGRILYQHSGDRSYGLLNVDGSSAGTIEAPQDVWLYGPRASADAGRIAFRGTGIPGLWVVALDDGTWMRISERSLGPVAWSVDGDSIYAMPAEGRDDASREIYAVPADGGEARLVAELPAETAVHPWNASLHSQDGLFIGAVFDASVDAWVIEGFDPSG